MTDQEAFSTILDIASSEPGIRAVLLEGSRANPNIAPDRWQDFDIVYVTESNDKYVDGSWIEEKFLPRFGEVAIRQIPDNGDTGLVYTWLIQFANGVRIDLTFNPVAMLMKPGIMESNTGVLLDKDGVFGFMPEPSDKDFLTRLPSEFDFLSCSNEFWWVSPYVTKALCRGQLLLALRWLEEVVREEYCRMLEWLVICELGKPVNLGKHGCDILGLAPFEYLEPLIESFCKLESGEIRKALSGLNEAFPKLASSVGEKLGYSYNASEGEKTLKFMREFHGESGTD
ncbi:MAG: aminoglycoside 6-adenylyltransferase [Clostridiales bacterium]|jgi:aminoglycoside 6-adenylyltransferase|nr:aminoglycoside 6-adenylyltransferase [Clostridiales bacterium]